MGYYSRRNFLKVYMPSFVGSNSPSTWRLRHLFPSIRRKSFGNKASYPRRPESSNNLLWEPQFSRKFFFYRHHITWQRKFRKKMISWSRRWNWFLVHFTMPSLSHTTFSSKVKNEWSCKTTVPTPWRREGTLPFTWRRWKAEWRKIKHVEGSRRGSIAVCCRH